MNDGRIEGSGGGFETGPETRPGNVEADVLGNPEHDGDWKIDGDDYPALRQDQARDPATYMLSPGGGDSGPHDQTDASEPRELAENEVVDLHPQPDSPTSTNDDTARGLERTATQDQVQLHPIADDPIALDLGRTATQDQVQLDFTAVDGGDRADGVARSATVEDVPDSVSVVEQGDLVRDRDDRIMAVGDTPREFPSEQADRRADLWHLQGENEKGYQGTCTIASSAEMLTDQSGERVTENELVQHAAGSGYCATELDTADSMQQGGMDLDHVRMLHEDYGLESERVHGGTQEQLAASVEQGDGVIAAVQAAEYWPADGFEPGQQDHERGMPGTDHAVWVTGVSRDDSGAITGFYVNDTGLPDGAKKCIGSDDFRRAWEDRGGAAIVSRRM